MQQVGGKSAKTSGSGMTGLHGSMPFEGKPAPLPSGGAPCEDEPRQGENLEMQALTAAVVAIIDGLFRAVPASLRRLADALWSGLGHLTLLASRIVDWWRTALPHRRGLAAMAALCVALMLFAWPWRDMPGNWLDVQLGRRPLLAAKSWYYHLDQIDLDIIAKSDADLIVMDYARDGGKSPITPGDIQRLKRKADGTSRRVVSYMSIGEAESYRFYWQDAWSAPAATMPDWHLMENCAWPKAHAVRFWHAAWKDIIISGKDAYLKRIVDAGFDGVYLDRVDIYERFIDKRPQARDDMITFVTEIAAAGRAMKPGFLIIPQNADDLLGERRYRRVIDALGKEDLLHGQTGTGVRNVAKDIASSKELLGKLQADYKPIFAVEYLVTRESIAETRAELEKLGIVPTFQHRSLDGSDPTGPRIRTDAEHGTPEWISKNCTKENSW